jgi:peptidoglycan/LPS O-acetylase OafA/YrhL
MHRYLYSLDYLRGFAALAVCLFHFTDKADYLPATNVFKQLFSTGHFGVEIFFIISGLVIPYSMYKGGYSLAKIWIFLKKRFVRIEPPYLLCVCLALLLNFLTTKSPFYTGKAFSIDYQQLFYHLGYLNAFMGKDWLNQVFWTLAVEFQYYLLIALLFPLVNHKKSVVWMLALICFNALSFSFDRNYLFNFSIFFTTGIVFFRFFTNKIHWIDGVICSVAILAFLVFRYSYQEIVVVLLTSIVILLPLRPTVFSEFFGNISYSLYLLHLPIGLRIINLTQRFTTTELLREVMVLAALIISVGVAYLYYKSVEKPFKMLSAQIRYKERQVAANEVAAGYEIGG